jgi:hypothetical protein
MQSKLREGLQILADASSEDRDKLGTALIGWRSILQIKRMNLEVHPFDKFG